MGRPQVSRRTIRRQQLRAIVSLANNTIYDMEQRGAFAQRFYLTSRCVFARVAGERGSQYRATRELCWRQLCHGISELAPRRHCRQ